MAACTNPINDRHCFHPRQGPWWDTTPPDVCCWCGATDEHLHGPHRHPPENTVILYNRPAMLEGIPCS